MMEEEEEEEEGKRGGGSFSEKWCETILCACVCCEKSFVPFIPGSVFSFVYYNQC